MSKELPSKPLRDLTGFKELKSFSVYINLFSRTKINGITRSVFKIIVEDNISHHKFIGYSFEKSRNSIDIFVSYVLSSLAERSKFKNSMKILGDGNFQPSDYVDYIPSRRSRSTKVVQGDVSHREIIQSIYRELIFNNGKADFEGYFESSNPILPPIFVDSFISDIEKIVRFTDFWQNYSVSDQDNKIYLETLAETEKAVEKYEKEFDFENAIKLYNRISSASSEIRNSEKITARVLLKKVKIFFHLEQYDKCRHLIESGIQKFEG